MCKELFSCIKDSNWGKKQLNPSSYKINYSNENSSFEKWIAYALSVWTYIISCNKTHPIVRWVPFKAPWLFPVEWLWVLLCYSYRHEIHEINHGIHPRRHYVACSGGSLLFTYLNVNRGCSPSKSGYVCVVGTFLMPWEHNWFHFP